MSISASSCCFVLPLIVLISLFSECVDLHGEFSFLRIDTSINCHSTSYRKFVILNIFFILLYQFIPITWLILLYRCKNKLIQFDIDIDINDDDYNHKINLKERKKMNLENKRRQRMSNKCSKNIMYASLESDDHDEDVNEDVNKEKESAKLNHVFSQNIWLPRLKFLWQVYMTVCVCLKVYNVLYELHIFCITIYCILFTYFPLYLFSKYWYKHLINIILSHYLYHNKHIKGLFANSLVV